MSHSADLNPPSATPPNELGAALRNWRVLAIVFVCLAIVFIYGYIQRANAAAQLETEIGQMHKNIEAAHLRTAALEEELRYAASDAYLDRIAREELGLAKAGETALVVIDADTGPDGQAARTMDTAAQPATLTSPTATTEEPDSRSGAQFRAGPEMPQNGNLSTDAAPLWQAWLDLFTSPTRP